MTFRRAHENDIPALRSLAHKIWHACYPAIIPAEQITFMLEWMYSEPQIRAELERGVQWELILSATNEPIGFLACETEADGRLKLNKLYVLPEMQGQGIGRAALEHVQNIARDAGANAVWMQVNKRNARAIAAYQKAGFDIVQDAVFEIGGGFVMDDYLMQRPVQPGS
jgi:ribosomal protein S18 acetylase RimI-like enzyme